MPRICVFASSSADTPPAFLEAAARLGMLLAQGGHVCVNGGGRSGGMGALNAAVSAHGGSIVAVIHSRWVVDGAEFAVADAGPGSRMLVVDGDDLAARKRALRDQCDAIIVLPGGPGTWDEMFELVALRQLGMSALPICLVSIGGFYDGFLAQLARAQADCVIKLDPHVLLPSFETVDAALSWTLAASARGHDELLAKAVAARVNYRDECARGAKHASAAVDASALVPSVGGSSSPWAQSSRTAVVGTVALAVGIALGATLFSSAGNGAGNQPSVRSSR